jgi:hypothetical protein
MVIFGVPAVLTFCSGAFIRDGLEFFGWFGLSQNYSISAGVAGGQCFLGKQ